MSHLDDLEVDVKQWELLRRGEISEYGTERRLLTKGGEEIVTEIRMVREEDASGELLHVIAVIQDVTGRRISEGTMRLYERALEATQNGVVITDASKEDHPASYANAAFLNITGYEASEVIGRNCRFLNAQARDQAALGEIRDALGRGEPCAVMLRNHRKNGDGFWNQLSIAPVRNADGHLTHFVGIVVDATERVHAASEREALLASAETASRSKDRFLSVVSHELRSPLNAILAWTSLLEEAEGPADLRRAVEAIEAATRAQTRLVDDLLDASRLRVGGLEVEPILFEVVSRLRTEVEQLQPIAAAAGVTLHFESGRDGLEAMLDPERLGQILRNLVDNALKFTPDGGRVDVTVGESQDPLTLEVRDTGRGIAEEDLPRVFGEFWQAERRGGSGGKGLGLGLAVVKHLVERQGGSIDVESEGIDRGACFRVSLPRDGSRSAGQDAATEKPKADRLAGVEIVVVDDEEGVAEALAKALRQAGAVAHEAMSVAEALRHFEHATPHALVSDIGLPDRDGLALIRAVREMGEPKRSVLALAVTGFADRAERRRIQRAGYDAYLAKPVEPAVVVDRVATLWRALRARAPSSRTILLVSDPSEQSRRLREVLEGAGHRVLEATASHVEGGARPELILVCLPLAGVSALSFTKRLEASGFEAPVVAVLGHDAEADQKPFDFVLWRPVRDEALLRIARLAGKVG